MLLSLALSLLFDNSREAVLIEIHAVRNRAIQIQVTIIVVPNDYRTPDEARYKTGSILTLALNTFSVCSTICYQTSLLGAFN